MKSFGRILFLIFNLQLKCCVIRCTIDVNLGELEYLAAHMDPFECIRLIAALHYTTYELPQSIAGAERRVDEEIPCLRHLIHWNSSPNEGKGNTHEHLEHRLRQLNRNDLADWLGKIVFKQLGKDLEESLKNPFGELGERETETQYPLTLEPPNEPDEENAWLPIDTLLLALLVALIATLLIVAISLVIHRIKLHRHQRIIENARAKEKRGKRIVRNGRRDQEVGWD